MTGKLEVAARATELLPEAPASRAQVDPESVRDQLKRILASSAFNASKRCHTLLSHVVEATLIGQRESLKERMLGVEVFHRDPAYDTASDPVVRMAAGEVRKRLAQYYYDHAHAHEIRIELPAGSYVPVFYVNVTDNEKYESAIIPLSLDLDSARDLRRTGRGDGACTACDSGKKPEARQYCRRFARDVSGADFRSVGR